MSLRMEITCIYVYQSGIINSKITQLNWRLEDMGYLLHLAQERNYNLSASQYCFGVMTAYNVRPENNFIILIFIFTILLCILGHVSHFQ